MEKEVKPSQIQPAGVMAKLGRRPDEVSGSGSHYGSNSLKKLFKMKPDIRLLTDLPLPISFTSKITASEICFNVKER